MDSEKPDPLVSSWSTCNEAHYQHFPLATQQFDAYVDSSIELNNTEEPPSPETPWGNGHFLDPHFVGIRDDCAAPSVPCASPVLSSQSSDDASSYWRAYHDHTLAEYNAIDADMQRLGLLPANNSHDGYDGAFLAHMPPRNGHTGYSELFSDTPISPSLASSSDSATSASTDQYAAHSTGYVICKDPQPSSCFPSFSSADSQHFERNNHRVKTRQLCHLCGKDITIRNLKAHQETHDVDRPKPFSCTVPGCRNKYYRRHDLARHHTMVHEADQRMYTK